MEIENKVVESQVLPWDELKTYEFNDLKSPTRDISKLKNAIVNEGFCFPFFVWAGHRYVIDGNGRNIALCELEQEGYQIKDLPVVYIRAENKAHAKKLVLMASSQHGDITQESFDIFIQDLKIEGIDDYISIDGISVDVIDCGDDISINNDYLGNTKGLSDKYSKNIKAPIYEPTGNNPSVQELINTNKRNTLVEKIKALKVESDEKQFLLLAAERFLEFNYSKIADYYSSHKSSEIKNIMEDLALVIIDYNKALENGFVELNARLDDLRQEELIND